MHTFNYLKYNSQSIFNFIFTNTTILHTLYYTLHTSSKYPSFYALKHYTINLYSLFLYQNNIYLSVSLFNHPFFYLYAHSKNTIYNIEKSYSNIFIFYLNYTILWRIFWQLLIILFFYFFLFINLSIFSFIIKTISILFYLDFFYILLH